MDLQLAIATANEADEAYSAAIKAEGFKSRWDLPVMPSANIRAAYLRKVRADEAVHEAFKRN